MVVPLGGIQAEACHTHIPSEAADRSRALAVAPAGPSSAGQVAGQAARGEVHIQPAAVQAAARTPAVAPQEAAGRRPAGEEARSWGEVHSLQVAAVRRGPCLVVDASGAQAQGAADDDDEAADRSRSHTEEVAPQGAGIPCVVVG